MFEATFKIAVLVESNEQGQRIFPITHGARANEMEFSSLLETVYNEEVYPTLRTGDTLTITVHLDVPTRGIERTVRFREDEKFEGDGLQQPTADLLPFISTMYEQFSKRVVPGDVFRITFQVQRP